MATATMHAGGVRGALALPLTLTAALVAFVVTGFVGFTLGLVVHENVMYLMGYPLAFVEGAIGAAVAAKWVSDAVAHDGTYADLQRLMTRATGWGCIAGFATGLILYFAVGGGPLAVFLVPGVFVMATAIALWAARIRSETKPRFQLRWSLGLLLLVPVGWALTVGLACATDACGA